MILLALTILRSGIWLSMLCALAGLGFAFFLIRSILSASPGNERMQQVAGAIQEGAKAYLNRQVMTISAIAAVIFVLLFIFKDHATAVGFVIGAACSLAAGYIGMRIAVLANTRTTQAAATRSR
jgi:K(+)-stimulated pyrophosphate-energized sodium pump